MNTIFKGMHIHLQANFGVNRRGTGFGTTPIVQYIYPRVALCLLNLMLRWRQATSKKIEELTESNPTPKKGTQKRMDPVINHGFACGVFML